MDLPLGFLLVGLNRGSGRRAPSPRTSRTVETSPRPALFHAAVRPGASVGPAGRGKKRPRAAVTRPPGAGFASRILEARRTPRLASCERSATPRHVLRTLASQPLRDAARRRAGDDRGRAPLAEGSRDPARGGAG